MYYLLSAIKKGKFIYHINVFHMYIISSYGVCLCVCVCVCVCVCERARAHTRVCVFSYRVLYIVR